MTAWRGLAALLLALATMGQARAEWMQASSPHFVIYADSSASAIQRFSQELERYHSAMAKVTNRDMPPPSPSNRVTIYVVGSEAEVRRLYGENARNVGGFYVARAGGSLAVVPRIGGGGREPDFATITLLHEYAHHFMLSSAAFGIPRWYSEGGAEFFASSSFGSDGGVTMGKPAGHRAAELAFAPDVTATQLLDPASYRPKPGVGRDAFYGKSWLLFHYLTFEPARRGQMQAYLRGLTAGKSQKDAAAEAFGDFRRLEGELERYWQRPRMLAFILPGAMIQPGATTLRKLELGEAAVMPLVIRSRRGVTPEQAMALLPEVRAVAARFPADAAVLSALAEAENDAGNPGEAVAAADRALAIDRNQVNAYIQKGLALFGQANQSADPALMRRARQPFLALNRIENDHPAPLLFNYLTQRGAADKMPESAVLGLERASQLAPFDLNLRMMVAQRQIADGLKEAARQNLLPVAYNPHGGPLASEAQRLLGQLGGALEEAGEDAEATAAVP